MSQFQQFDISDFLDEIQDPLFLIDADEIIFFNDYFKKNFTIESDSWKTFFRDESLIHKLQFFFQTGELPSARYLKSLSSGSGEIHRFEWIFVNLPSSYSTRFLIVKGNRVRYIEDEYKEDVLLDADHLANSELQYMQSILSNSYDLITILDSRGNYKFTSASVGEKLGIPADLILEKNFFDLINEGVIEIVKGDFNKISKTKEEVNIDFWIRKPGHRSIYIESFAKNMLDHPLINGILISARDITAYIETDLSLQRRYEIENLISQISSQLINAPILDLEAIFKNALERFGKFLQSERSKIFILNSETQTFELLSIYDPLDQVKEGNKQVLNKIINAKLNLDQGEVLLLPHENKRLLLIPMISVSKLLGVIVHVLGDGAEIEETQGLQVFRQLGNILAGAYQGSQMTKRLERNENLLTTTELLSKSGSWRYSTQKNKFYMSGGLSKLFGFGIQPITASFTALLYKIEKPYRPGFVQNLKKSIQDICHTSGEFIIKDEEDKQVFVSYEIDAKKDFLTQGIEVFGFCTDISHKRAADNYLKLQSQILTQVSDPIVVTDLDLDVIYLNEAAIQLCCPETTAGYSGQLEKLINIKLEESKDLKKITAELEQGDLWKKEVFLQTKHTGHSPFEVSIKAFNAEQESKIGYSFVFRNLTERYESQQIAKRAQLIVENSPAVLFRVDPERNFQIIYISENISQFGYQASDLIERNVSILELLHPEDAKQIIENFDQSRSEIGIPAFSSEFRIVRKDGSYAWVEDKTRDVSDESGKIVIHEGLFQDITDRKNLEIFNQEKDKQYRVLAANIPGINIFLLDKDRNYILAEGTNFEFWGLSREDFEGRNIADLSISEYEGITENLDRVFKNREIVEMEFLFLGRYYHRTLRPIIENDQVEYVLSIVRDIQDEHQAKVDLLRSEEKYRTLVEESTEIIFSLTDAFDLYYVSPNVTQFLGYQAEEVVGKSIFNYINPDDLDIFQEMLGDTKDFLAENQFLEFRLRHKNGDYRVFNSNGRMIEDKEGGKRYYTGIARDISRLKEAQKELFLAKEKAEQASIAKSQFLSIMSHEIRTPMNAVIGLAHFLMEEDPRTDQLENLRTLQFSAENMMGLINDILDFNKIDSGKVELEEVEFDLRHLINRIVHSHSFEAKKKSLKISSEIDGNIPSKLIGDPLRIGQIVNNLVSNSIKFTERGFVRINLQQEPSDKEFCEIRFKFEDTGIGIDQDKFKTIFEAFTQASTETTRKYGGTGLGLAIVKRLVELHGGTIEIDSIPNRGSIFEFVLKFKFVEEKIPTGNKESGTNIKSLEEASILVAEDNAVNQILIRKFLTKWNTGNLVIVSDGQEALDAFESEDFNLVLLDLQMPVLDGFSAAKVIRKHLNKRKRMVPILVLTASSLHEIKDEMDEIGIDDFVPKPFTPEELYSKLKEYLPAKIND